MTGIKVSQVVITVEKLPVPEPDETVTEGLNESQIQEITDAASSVTGDLSTIIAEVGDELSAEGETVLEELQKEHESEDKIRVEVKVSMKVEVKGYTPEPDTSRKEKASMKLDITPVYQIYQTVGDGEETAVLEEPQPIKKIFEQAVKIKITLPANFVKNENTRVVAKHYAQDGIRVLEWLKTTLMPSGSDMIVSFFANSFSEYELLADAPSVNAHFHTPQQGEYAQEFAYDHSIGQTIQNAAAKAGYTFVGWGTSEDTAVTDTGHLFSGTVSQEMIDRMAELAEDGILHLYPIYRQNTSTSGNNNSSSSRPSGGVTPTPVSTEKKDTETKKPTSDTEPEAQPMTFIDVSRSDWFRSAVDYVSANGVMAGNGSRFSPNDQLTRGMIAQILYNMEGGRGSGSKGFPDVKTSDWFYRATAWAAGSGVMAGYSNGNFGPNDALTREQLAVALYRYARIRGYDVTGSADLSRFTDSAQVANWSAAAVRWAVANGLLSGKSNGRLDPTGYATRAEVASILMRFCENVAK